MKKILFIALLALLGTSSCKKWQHKYPEDTERTKLTPTERLINKTWTLSKTTINGVDISDTVYNRIGKYSVQFYNSSVGGFGAQDFLSGGANTDIEGGISTLWKFYEKDSKIGWGRTSTSAPPIDGYVLLYIRASHDTTLVHVIPEIIKLTETEFKIQTVNTKHDTTLINTFIIN
jgi:hypothetical protein